MLVGGEIFRTCLRGNLGFPPQPAFLLAPSHIPTLLPTPHPLPSLPPQIYRVSQPRQAQTLLGHLEHWDSNGITGTLGFKNGITGTLDFSGITGTLESDETPDSPEITGTLLGLLGHWIPLGLLGLWWDYWDTGTQLGLLDSSGITGTRGLKYDYWDTGFPWDYWNTRFP